MTETNIPTIELSNDDPLTEPLKSLGEAIIAATFGHNDEHLSGRNSRSIEVDDKTKYSFIYRENESTNTGPEVLINKQLIEDVKGRGVLKSYTLRWLLNFPDSVKDRTLTVTNPDAKKDKHRIIRGDSFKQYDKDLALAHQIVDEAQQLLEGLNGEA